MLNQLLMEINEKTIQKLRGRLRFIAIKKEGLN